MEMGEEEAASSTTGISFSKAPQEKLKSYSSFSSTELTSRGSEDYFLMPIHSTKLV